MDIQLGFVVHPKEGKVARHFHKLHKKEIDSTTEIILVYKGSCTVDIYDQEKKLVTSRKLCKGDIVVLFSCGHAFQMIENTVLLEIKQGPYLGQDEKELF